MGRRLYVGNLSYQVQESELEQLFAQAGSVASVFVPRDKFTGQGRGFAFVEMGTDAEAQVAIDLCRDAVVTSLIVGAPILIVGMLVGLLIGLIQALTQVQDQTVSFVPKIVAMVAALIFCLPWIMQHLVEYSESVIGNIPRIIAGG